MARPQKLLAPNQFSARSIHLASMRIPRQLSPPSLPSVDQLSQTYVRSGYEQQKELDAVRFFIVLIVVGTLALAGVLPAAAQSKSKSDKGTSVGVATTR